MTKYFLFAFIAALGISFASAQVGFAADSPSSPPGQAAPNAASHAGGMVLVSTLEKPQNPRKLDEKDMAGYLFVYFKDQTHSAYFAISRDGYHFTDINGGQPVFLGADLAEQKGVRDPHITRGPDGGFYLAMTDLHINGQRAGYRTNQWERPQEKYGWGNNRAIVMMKSFDLIHWTHSDFRLDKAFPDLGDFGCAWAPETIYDEHKGKMMVYLSIRMGNDHCKLYYSYADDAFTKLETKPELIMDDYAADGDIFKAGDKFILHYVWDAKIWQAVSDRINGGYQPGKKRIDPEKVSTEAPNGFRRLGTDSYVLMYDAYGGGNMGFSETKDFVTYQDLGHFNDGVMKGANFSRPKHGAITHLTLDELKAIKAHWNLDINLD